MAKTIRINGISEESVKNAVQEMKQYAQWVKQKEAELIAKLAQRGKTVAEIKFASAAYDGTNDVSVRVDNTGSVAVIYAEGSAVAFIEFGSGAKYGYGHPKAGEFGMGPGTYPDGKGHWDSEKGWWYAHGQHSYGNPPAMAMYQAVQKMTEEITKIAKEVFSA